MVYLFLSLVISTASFAEVVLRQTEANGVRKVELDLNLDQKVDRIDHYRDGQIFLTEEDAGFGGSLNQRTQFFDFKNSKEPISISEIDKNRDGKVDRIEKTYRIPEHDRIVTTISVSTKLDAQFDRTWSSVTKLRQKRDESCGSLAPIALQATELSQQVSSLGLGIESGYLRSVPGYRVDAGCLQKWGNPDFVTSLTTAMSKGKSCLAELAQKTPGKMNGAGLNLQRLNALQVVTPVTITCSETSDYDWEGTAGHASTGRASEIKSLGIKHPYISINPFNPKGRNPTDDDVRELQATLFHEQLHNLGIKHGEGIEYPYTCESCCVSSGDADEKAAACRVCQGDYSGAADRAYVRDMMNWGELSFNADRSQTAIENYISENPGERWGVFALAANHKGQPFSRVGGEMAKILEARMKNLSTEEKKLLEDAKYYTSQSWGQQHAKLIAEAQVNLFLDQSQEQALAALQRNKQQLKILFTSAKTAKGDDKYFAEELVRSTNSIIDRIWLDGYPRKNEKTSSAAYELARYLGRFD